MNISLPQRPTEKLTTFINVAASKHLVVYPPTSEQRLENDGLNTQLARVVDLQEVRQVHQIESKLIHHFVGHLFLGLVHEVAENPDALLVTHLGVHGEGVQKEPSYGVRLPRLMVPEVEGLYVQRALHLNGMVQILQEQRLHRSCYLQAPCDGIEELRQEETGVEPCHQDPGDVHEMIQNLRASYLLGDSLEEINFVPSRVCQVPEECHDVIGDVRSIHPGRKLEVFGILEHAQELAQVLVLPAYLAPLDLGVHKRPAVVHEEEQPSDHTHVAVEEPQAASGAGRNTVELNEVELVKPDVTVLERCLRHLQDDALRISEDLVRDQEK